MNIFPEFKEIKTLSGIIAGIFISLTAIIITLICFITNSHNILFLAIILTFFIIIYICFLWQVWQKLRPLDPRYWAKPNMDTIDLNKYEKMIKDMDNKKLVSEFDYQFTIARLALDIIHLIKPIKFSTKEAEKDNIWEAANQAMWSNLCRVMNLDRYDKHFLKKILENNQKKLLKLLEEFPDKKKAFEEMLEVIRIPLDELKKI